MGLHFGDHTPSTRGRATPYRGNCIIRAATRRRYTVSQLLMLQNPHHHRHGERPGHGKPGRDAREQRQGAAIARQQPLRAASVQNSPCTSRTAPLPVQNSPRSPPLAGYPVQNSPSTPPLTARPVQNSPCSPEMALFGTFCPHRESFVPLSPPRTRARRILYRFHHQEPKQGEFCTEHEAELGLATTAQQAHRCEGHRRSRRNPPHDRRAVGRASMGWQGQRQPNFARNLSRSFFETSRKRCNSNDTNSKFERARRELRAELRIDSQN